MSSVVERERERDHVVVSELAITSNDSLLVCNIERYIPMYFS